MMQRNARWTKWCACIAILGLFALPVAGEVFNWTGAVDLNWDEPGNWDCTGTNCTNEYPDDGDDNVFVGTIADEDDIVVTTETINNFKAHVDAGITLNVRFISDDATNGDTLTCDRFKIEGTVAQASWVRVGKKLTIRTVD